MKLHHQISGVSLNLTQDVRKEAFVYLFLNHSKIFFVL